MVLTHSFIINNGITVISEPFVSCHWQNNEESVVPK